MARKKKNQDEDPSGFGEQASGQRARLTPVDVQQRVFRLSFRGYNERDVDEFLDHVTEELAALHEENKRLREQSGGGGGGDLGAARDQAEAIVREAREHAARLVEDAGGSSGGGAGLSGSFLLRERDFLQKLASSVQDHARWLKEEAQRQRTGPAPAAGPKSASKAPAKKATATAAKATKTKDVSAGEATAAWGPPQQGMDEPSGGLGREQTPGESDPLLAAWESAFTAEGKQGKSKDGEPSLRELFWGEE